MDEQKNGLNPFYEEFEVFSKKKEDGPLQYQFSLLAPNEEMAIVLAKENFFRREKAVDIWVVRRNAIRKLSQSEKESLKKLDKHYRETKGYADLNQRWRNFKEKQDNGTDEKKVEKA
ncbi:ring-1,2-phenylacetyl-CoA epoxidase subunit PaaB [Scopulibacillus darangshiensis]|uniref:Ring-1,2-phenylacetyl-CoA epoxidase subunit PaaB n=1 Tax=Scopulibacillus darangshiensis TaxID=442528 RepID=A0A4R2P584_9BACL|nr:1,2-phenylacetyl-CoA epoxidase subunit PaaB [Scopulibacillus darangshiensis]TCP29254.1 ring-1,2-phenylacetyl-CoA epoxidase subunit PaaB [Scopulibacillus darangshiensis]